jgi:mannose/fructose/N-acetylgalactosamine-specific phosphotransferase system component IIB
MVKLIRIDDRLVHGQVAFTWVPSLGVDCLLVANDKIVKDDFQKMTLGLAKPAGTKLFIKSVSDATILLNDEKNKSMKILILINSVLDAFTVANAVPEIKSINFGGIRAREGATMISKAVAITNDDVPLLKQLTERGIELEIRQVPSDQKLMVKTLI